MARLAIALLGGFDVALDQRPVAGWETSRARALLAYLAVERHRPHRREVLAGLLWPEAPEVAARTYLRQALANVRLALRDAWADPPFLLVCREHLQLNS